MRPRPPVLAVLALLAVPACVPILEGRIRTRILADGTTIRDTTWTKIRRDADAADERRFNERPIADDLSANLGSGFPSVERTDDVLRFSGVFTSPAAVPPDFRRDVPVLEASSTRRIEFQREDLLFGTRYLYRETFVDAIQPEDEKTTRKELLRFTLAQIERAAELEFGHAYELDAFDRYLEEELGPVLDSIVDVYWREKKQLGVRDPHTRETGADRLLKGALARAERLGLAIDPSAGDDAAAAAFRTWLAGVLATTLRPKDTTAAARPLSKEHFRHLFPQDDPWAGLRVAHERLAAQDFGSTEALSREFQRRLYALTGTYGSPPAEAEFRFDCALELPGLLLRTNGFLESGNTSFWRFTGDDLFPHGYTMEAESVVLDSPLLGRLRELEPTLDRRHAVDLIRALKDVPPPHRARMKELLETAARHGTLTALEPQTPEDSPLLETLTKILDTVRKP